MKKAERSRPDESKKAERSRRDESKKVVYDPDVSWAGGATVVRARARR
jgi:hypothetical protein